MFSKIMEKGFSRLIVALCSTALVIAFVPAQAIAVASDGVSAEGEAANEVNEAEAVCDIDEDGVLVAQSDARSTINAGSLPLNRSVSGYLTSTYDTVSYSITTSSNCTLRIQGSATNSVFLELCTSNGKRIRADVVSFSGVTGKAPIDITYYLNSGTYYIAVHSSSSETCRYEFTASTASTGVSFHEPVGGNDNVRASARAISLDKSYKAQFSDDEYTYSDGGGWVYADKDYYKVTLSKPSEILLSANASRSRGLFASIGSKDGHICSLSMKPGDANKSVKSSVLEPGTYYIEMRPNSSDADGGVYDFKVRAVHTMYRLYNPNSGEHFYTESASERDAVRKAGWRYEGEGWTAPVSSKTPVYRLYSGTDHHYTTSAAERDNLKKAGWKYEGIGWYSDDSKTVPLYRQFNPNVNPKAKKNNSGSHNYTTSKKENDSLVKAGWKAEGIGWYGC